MQRLEFENVFDRFQRGVVLSRQKIDIAELVPAFGELRRVLDHCLVVKERFGVIETQLRLARLLQQLPRFVVGKAAPEGPQPLFGPAGSSSMTRRQGRGPVVAEPTLALEAGQLDVLIQPTRSGEQTESFHMAELWDERLVGIVRRGHPFTRGRVTLKRFAAASHALVSPRGDPGGMVDDVLKQHGLSRHVAFTTPSCTGQSFCTMIVTLAECRCGRSQLVSPSQLRSS